MGKNYRDSWSMPVKLPVLRLTASKFIIEKMGGGQQTKSLHLFDKNGGHWVLRTVDKDVEAAVPKAVQNKLGKTLVQDMISASFPYSHVISGELAKAANIQAPRPQMVFVADDEGLQQYRSIFANQVCTLEATEPEQNTLDTEMAAAIVTADNKNRLLQKKILKVRLLDMLIGDWDRHDNQWQWVSKDSAGNKFYYVIPKDRDNALFYAEGILPTLVKSAFMTHLKGFKKNSSALKQLSKKAIGFDAYFLNALDENDWKETIAEFQQQMDDDAIVSSVKNLPENVYAQYGEELITKLKSRREGLMTNAMKYYRYLARAVDITGSDKEELFVASGNKDEMTITVYRVEKNSKQKIYERSFDRSETKAITLNGLKGADHFLVEDSAPSNFKLKIFGNEGKDVYTLKGKTKSKIVDLEHENNVVVNHAAAKIDFR
jgi:hypothetical protein